MYWFAVAALILLVGAVYELHLIAEFQRVTALNLAKIAERFDNWPQEQLGRDIRELSVQSTTAAERLNVIHGTLEGLRRDVRIMWTPEMVKNSTRRGYLGA